MKFRDKRILNKTINKMKKDNVPLQEQKKHIKKVESLIKINDKEERYSKLYDMICDYLDEEFQGKNICQFKDNICSRRKDLMERGIKKELYRDGCCYSYRHHKLCENLKDGRCTIKNIGCKLFTCPYLRKKGYKYTINQIYFARYFFNTRQKVYIQTTFFVDKKVVMKGILKRKRII